MRNAVGLAWLGASNFALCLPEVRDWVATERPDASWISVCGHGRSYCGPSVLGSRWLGRELPSIVESWSSVGAAASRGPSAGGRDAFPRSVDAVIGDFGNDLAYGRSPIALLMQVDRMLGEPRIPWRRVVLVAPPLESVRALSPSIFRWVSRLMFPGRGLDRDRVVSALEDLHQGLGELSVRYGTAWVEIPSDWIGADGIHVRRRFRRSFVRYVTEPLSEAAEDRDRTGRGPLAARSRGASRSDDWSPWWRRRPEREAIWWLGRRSDLRDRSAAAGKQRVRFL